MPEKQRLLRVTLLAYRNPKLSEDEFHHHWSNVHAPKVSAHLAKFGILSYRQVHNLHPPFPVPSLIQPTYVHQAYQNSTTLHHLYAKPSQPHYQAYRKTPLQALIMTALLSY